jgi:hypothetical protein
MKRKRTAGERRWMSLQESQQEARAREPGGTRSNYGTAGSKGSPWRGKPRNKIQRVNRKSR